MIKKVTPESVKLAVNSLLERKEIISARSVRDEIGYGSFTTISKYLKEISAKEDFSSNYDTKAYFAQALDNISQQASALSQFINPSIKSQEKDEQIFLLIYKSKVGSNFEGRKSLKEIETTSILNNTKNGISGALLVNEGRVLQVLEGQPYELIKLYQTIVQDSRNKDNKILCFVQIKDRIFPNSPMLTSEIHPELFNHCYKLLSNTKKLDINVLVNNLHWIGQIANEYYKFS